MLVLAHLVFIYLLFPGKTDGSKPRQSIVSRTSLSGTAAAASSSLQFRSASKTFGKSKDNIDTVGSSFSRKRATYKEAAVACNSDFAAQVAVNILKQGGSAADAAIGALLAEGLANPQSLGLGGGFLLTYFDARTNKVRCLNARECAPGQATERMFNKGGYDSGVTVAVPGELRGYWELHKEFGLMEWSKIFEPIIRACREGIPVTAYTSSIMKLMKKTLRSSPTLKQLFINPETNDAYNEGDTIKRIKLAETLEVVAKYGADALYNGKLTKNFVQDIQQKGGIISMADMNRYRAKWCEPTHLTLGDDTTLYSVPQPGAGLVLSLIMDVFSRMTASSDEVQRWFRFVETWKYAFGYKFHFEGPVVTADDNSPNTYDARTGESVAKLVAKANMTSDDVKHYTDAYGSAYYGGGTCHICILAPNGDAVSVTSSINSAFGALFASASTGIILNNHMMDFNIPDFDADMTPTNKISPYKQPLSSMSPSLVVNNSTQKVVMLVGAAGGSKIITSVSQVMAEHVLNNVPIHQAVQNKRLHHSLIPMKLRYEEGFSPKILDGLAKMGHTLKVIQSRTEDQMFPASSSVAVIVVEHRGAERHIEAYGDPRRLGASLGF